MARGCEAVGYPPAYIVRTFSRFSGTRRLGNTVGCRKNYVVDKIYGEGATMMVTSTSI